jgi:amino acid transporter
LEDDRLVVAALVVLVVMLGAMLTGGTVGQILFSYAIIAFFGVYVLLGVKSTAERHSWRPFLAAVGGVVALLAVVFAALWYFHHLNPSYTDPVYWLGFPRATAVVVYGLWMPPALVLMFSYPYLFDDYIWDSEEAEEFAEMERTRAGTGVTGGDD